MSEPRLEWEAIRTSVDGTGLTVGASRARIPGGWVLKLASSGSLCFVTDPGHAWGAEPAIVEDTVPQQVWRDLYGDQQKAVELRRDARRWRALVASTDGHEDPGHRSLVLQLAAGRHYEPSQEALTEFVDRLIAEQDAPSTGANLSDDGESL